MTNEELAIQIQAGNTQYYSELWQNVHRLMHKILHKKLLRIELPNYLTSEDIEQELYFALCNAVQAYDDTKPYKFTSYLDYHIMNAVRSALPSKPLKELSYNQTAGEDEETELEVDVEDETQVFNLDYNHLVNKPRINDVELIHDKTFEELGINPMTNLEFKEIFNRVFGSD